MQVAIVAGHAQLVRRGASGVLLWPRLSGRLTPASTPMRSPRAEPRSCAGWCWPPAARAGSGSPSSCCPTGRGLLLGHVLGIARECALGSAAVRARRPATTIRAARGPRRLRGGGEPPVRRGLLLVDRCGARRGRRPLRRPGADARRPARACRPQTVAALLAGRGDAVLAACSYEDGRGHPLAFGRGVFADLGALHGDRGVWKLLDRRGVRSSTSRSPARCRVTSTPGRTTRRCSRRPSSRSPGPLWICCQCGIKPGKARPTPWQPGWLLTTSWLLFAAARKTAGHPVQEGSGCSRVFCTRASLARRRRYSRSCSGVRLALR